jgi:hypothetical protein
VGFFPNSLIVLFEFFELNKLLILVICNNYSLTRFRHLCKYVCEVPSAGPLEASVAALPFSQHGYLLRRLRWYAAKKFPLKLGYVNRSSARDKKKSQRF